jgi:asparagine N-glycosylation enzyme membrane subunit Stt3
MGSMKEHAVAIARGGARLWRVSPSAWLIALAMAASIVIRVIPLYLPAADISASQFVREKAMADLVQSDPAAARLDPSELQAAVTQWIIRHADTLVPLERQAKQKFRDALTFEGDDGARHVYLGDEDGYYWLKLAKSVLANGTVCDRIERGACIDALADAPVGEPIEYVGSPHVYSIAAVHRLMTWLRPGFPLSTTAMLVPMALSALMVIPAFLVAQRVSNRLGGLMAALLLSFNSVVLFRTGDGDDDIWTVALPVFSLGLITAAFARRSWSERVLLSGLGGITLAVLAAAWKGWPLFALATLAGLVALAAWAALTAFIARARGQPRSYALAWNACLCTLSVVAGFAAAGWLLAIQIDFGLITGGLSSIVGRAAPASGPIGTAPMPNVFHLVGELAAVDAASLQLSIGPVATGLGLLGFALALGAPGRRQTLLVLPLLVLVPAVAALLGRYGVTRAPVLAIPALAGLAAAVGSWFAGSRTSDRAAATGILGLAWLGATLWMSFEGLRYVLLAVVPLSLAAGVSLGHVAPAVAALGLTRARLARAASVTVAGGLAAAALGPVAIGGLGEAMTHAPTINSAWAAAFAAIRAQSSGDAIVDIWWDYGHWAKYFTERAVVLDGASLQRRSVHWMAHALAAASDTEAIGVLRMMNCGTVADPDGGPSARPYDMLIRWSADPGLAFRSVMEMSRLPREQAADFLRGAGLPEARVATLLRTVYCTPPQGFLVLTTDLLDSRGWMVFGLWDPGLAHIVELARRSSVDAALPVIEQKYGLPEDAARAYYTAASRVQTEEDEIAFAAPGAQTWSTDWRPCVPEAGTLRCTLDLGDFAVGPHLQDLVVDPDNPERTRIRIVPRPDAAALEATPALVEIARRDQLQDVPLATATVGLAVLVDPDQKRVFVGTPGVVHSVLARLALLDGRYSPGFQKIYDQLGVDRQRITVWRIIWGQP